MVLVGISDSYYRCPVGHVWAAAEGISSLKWVYTRSTLPQGFLGVWNKTIFNISFLSLALYYMLSRSNMGKVSKFSRDRHADAANKRRNNSSNRKSEDVTNINITYEYFKYFCICNLILWILIFVCVGRSCILNMTIVPNRLQPHLAWSLIGMLSSCTSYFALYLLLSIEHIDVDDKVCILEIIRSKRYSCIYLFSTIASIMLGISIIVVIRFFVFRANSFIIWILFSIYYLFFGKQLFHILVTFKKISNGTVRRDTSSSLPKYA